MPLVSQAMTQLGNEIWMAKYARCHALKVIHGYGSRAAPSKPPA